MKLHIRLKEILDERGITQKEFATLTGIRPATISEICNNQRSTINRDQITIIAEKLGITDISELMRFIED